MEKVEEVSEDKVMNMANIVVAVDQSQESMRACEWACNHVLSAHTNVGQSYNFTLLHVQSPVCVSSGPETHVVYGEAKEKICDAAHKLGAQFLVMGSHGRGPFLRAIMGSVSDYCSRNALCPVVVVNNKVL